MTKRDIVETVYEYDDEGKLLKKTVTETHEEEDIAYKSHWTNVPYINCTDTNSTSGLTNVGDSITVCNSNN